MSEKGTGGRKLSTTQIILLVGIILIFAAVLGVGGLIVSRLGQPAQTQVVQKSGPADTTVGALVLDSERAEAVIAEMEQKAREGMFDVTMKTIWTFPDGESVASDAYAANAETNWKPIYFDVVLQEDNTVLYTSPELPVGYGIDEIKLDVPLEKGSYPCVCTYHLLNEDKTEASTVSVALQIDVLA